MIPFKHIREHSDIKAFLVLAEREMSSEQMKKREEIAQSMSDADFKKRYGKDWKSVKMATATKQAMKKESYDDESEEEYIDHWCAQHVYHDVFGEGVVVEGEHAIPDEEGVIDWYTVEFPHGKETVFTEDIEVMHERMHGHMMKKKKKVMEDTEELEELSRKTLTSYVNKAMSGKAPPMRKIVGRLQGLDRARQKIRKPKEPSTTNEEVEELEELSKSTLASYAKKATRDARIKMATGKDFERHAITSRKPEYKASAKNWEDKYKSDARRREAGVNKAIDRLAKEEVELEEAKRIVSKHGDGVHTAKVYRDPEYDEYQVHFFKNGKHMGEGPVSYHDDKDDAQSTAELSVKRMNARVSEDVEELEELKKSTMGSYVKKASIALGDAAFHGGRAFAKGDLATSDYKAQKEKNRVRGIYRAATKLAKEEVEEVEEALVGNQHKIDMNKNNKIDAHDFQLLQKIKKARAK
jgi:hypothetical protein